MRTGFPRRSASAAAALALCLLSGGASASSFQLYATVGELQGANRFGVALVPDPIGPPTFLGSGLPAGGSFLTDGDFDASGELWAPSYHGGLWRFDASSYSLTPVGEWGIPDFSMFSIAFDPAGNLLGVGRIGSSFALYDIDQSSAQLTLRTPLARSVFGIDFAPDGTLFATIAGSIVELNPDNGQIVRTVANGSSGWGTIDYGPDALIRTLLPFDTVYVVDPALGTVAPAGRLTGYAVFGLATTIPAPAATTLLFASALAATRRRR